MITRQVVLNTQKFSVKSACNKYLIIAAGRGGKYEMYQSARISVSVVYTLYRKCINGYRMHRVDTTFKLHAGYFL
jgi:hypothetical protein